MTTTTNGAAGDLAAAIDQPLSQRKLPRWAPWGSLAVAVVLSLAVLLPGGTSKGAVAVLAALLHLVVIGVASGVREGSRKAKDRLVTALVTIAFLVAMVPLVSVVWTVVDNGRHRLDADFFTMSMFRIVGEGGGALHAIWGTIIITLIATVISVPIGLMTAVYLVEYGAGSRLARAITFLVDVMTGIPSIVAGLAVAALFALVSGPGTKLGIMGAIALAILMVPTVVRSTEEMLKLVPNDLREAAYALGVPKWRTVVKVVLRTSVSGIATGITLAVARVAGETAPLLITVGITTGSNFNPFEGRMATLPVYAFYQYTQPGVPAAAGTERAWTAALVLIALVMLLNLVARLISRFFAPKTGR
ncbi:phosphate ABC transporter permease PstA [Kineococcus aurantiacus]|uniref:Phosphate transport system permease protein PstA n=1 Tax=Kineococcus aurantiacus TaxID=37633 RepID=A0A7Y9DJA0_9ACTN|nr:phosphate ABC transporter permease PstA [Kineococcus aurantiacus]NYD21704.1 phosphate transport system permease protein [Kineococcus aurantiacus]